MIPTNKQIKVALLGNPNTGKSSIFNLLTGLNQKTGNYPGITVERKIGICNLTRGNKAFILDLPGTYSLTPSSLDENIVSSLLLNKYDKDYPDLSVVISDIKNLKRNLLLFTQIKDLGIPTILVINMADRQKKTGIHINVPLLEKKLKAPIIFFSAKKQTGLEELKKAILNFKDVPKQPCLEISKIDPNYIQSLSTTFPNENSYKLWLLASQDESVSKNRLQHEQTSAVFLSKKKIKSLKHREVVLRYQMINDALKDNYKIDYKSANSVLATVDRILTHKVFGYLIFLIILFQIFQAIFNWSALPMDWIDGLFADFSGWIKATFPKGNLVNLIANGIIPGIAGIVIFIPQIAFLFFFLAILEESGYMSRVVFIMDKIMNKFGMSGKSIVPLVSGTACAIPSIMATRNIENYKERLITILVTPFVTCSARLPVYLIIISLVIPNEVFWGLHLHTICLMSLYLLGFLMAFFSAIILKKTLKRKDKRHFITEIPEYRMPILKNIFITVIDKTKGFVFGAGKIIFSFSIIIWFLASYGVSTQQNDNTDTEYSTSIHQVYTIEHSFLGKAGQFIEPVIKPLGFDWKIGIAILSSFVAREVFVSTLATIYNVSSDEENTIKNRMKMERTPDGKLVFNQASGISLLLFYVFAMQCMSTLAIVKKETNSWKWPLFQLISMTFIAYFSSLLVYYFLK